MDRFFDPIAAQLGWQLACGTLAWGFIVGFIEVLRFAYRVSKGQDTPDDDPYDFFKPLPYDPTEDDDDD